MILWTVDAYCHSHIRRIPFKIPFECVLRKQHQRSVYQSLLSASRARLGSSTARSLFVVTFRGPVERPMKRAGKTDIFQRVRAICNCLPPKTREEVGMMETGENLCKKVNRAYVTLEIEYVDKYCGICGKSGHTIDVCGLVGKINEVMIGGNKPVFRRASFEIPTCTYCKRIGHMEETCWDKHGRPGQDSVRSANEIPQAVAYTTHTPAPSANALVSPQARLIHLES